MSYWKLQSYERPTLGVALVVTEAQWQVTVGAATERPTRALCSPRATPPGWLPSWRSLELSDDLTGPPDYKRSVLRAHLERTLGSAP